MSQTCRRSNERAVMLTPDPASRQMLQDTGRVIGGPPQAYAPGAMEAHGRRCIISPLDHLKIVAGVCRPIPLIEPVDARMGPTERLVCMVPGRREHIPCIDWSE
jgi:hypothetical protein